MAVPACASGCPMVARLIAELARARGTAEHVEREEHGMHDDALTDLPEPHRRTCPWCGRHTSGPHTCPTH